MFKRIVAILLVMLVAISLVACSDGNKENNTVNQQPQTITDSNEGNDVPQSTNEDKQEAHNNNLSDEYFERGKQIWNKYDEHLVTQRVLILDYVQSLGATTANDTEATDDDYYVVCYNGAKIGFCYDGFTEDITDVETYEENFGKSEGMTSCMWYQSPSGECYIKTFPIPKGKDLYCVTNTSYYLVVFDPDNLPVIEDLLTALVNGYEGNPFK